ncbi:MAG: hypothetical protein AAGB34_05705, partial [Planctomycetota bacterium]
RLTAVVKAPDATPLPVWSTDESATLALLRQLLVDGAFGDDLERPARAWAANESPAAAWIVTDSSDAGPRIAFAELMGMPVSIDVSHRGDLTTYAVPSHEARVVELSPGVQAPVTVSRVGWSRELRPADRLTIAPAGLTVPRLWLPWSLHHFLDGEKVAEPPGYRTALRIFRAAEGTWRLYIECEVPEGTERRDDVVHVYLGEQGTRQPIRVDATGVATDWVDPSRRYRLPGFERSETRWSAIIDLPTEAESEDGSILFAVEHLRANDTVASWPRPMLPGQNEPGRVRLVPAP